MNTASIKHLKGEIVEVTTEIPVSGGNPFRFLFIVDAEGNRHQVITSSAQLDNFRIGNQSYSAALANGFMADVEVEERIADTTEYLDEKSGETKTHTQSGLALRSVMPLASFQKKLIEKTAIDEYNDARLSKPFAQLQNLGFDNKEIAIALQNF